MRKNIIRLITLLLLCNVSLHASTYWNSKVSEEAQEGIETATASIIADSFIPMTHYSKGNWTARITPTVFRVDRFSDDPEVKGDGFYGYGSALGGGYALSNSFMTYLIINYTQMEGDIRGRFYGEEYGSVTAHGEYKALYLTTGIGYDLVSDNSRWSIPLYAGLFCQYYDAEIDVPDYTNTLPAFTASLNLTGSGLLYGFAGGFAVSCRLFDSFKITPYYLMGMSFNEPELEAKLDHSLESSQVSEKVSTGRIYTSMYGLNLTFESEDNVSFSMSIGGYLSTRSDFISEETQNGLDIKSIVIAVSYNGGGY